MAGLAVFAEEPPVVRYHLRCSGSDTEVNISEQTSKEGSSSQEVLASFVSEDRHWERTLQVSPHLVQVKEPDGSWRRLPFTTDEINPKTTSFFHQGRVRTVLSVGGVGGSVEGDQSEGTVCAPMNGQVVKVVAEAGDCLECGDIVLILEAMKMENEVTAPISGTLTELSVQPGQTVAPGQTLFTIEAVE